jgi:hypothetical protein
MTAWHLFLISYPPPASSVRQVVDGATERWFFILPLIIAAGILSPLIFRTINFRLGFPAKAEVRVNRVQPIGPKRGQRIPRAQACRTNTYLARRWRPLNHTQQPGIGLQGVRVSARSGTPGKNVGPGYGLRGRPRCRHP